MVKSQNQNIHIWDPIVDIFMIFTSRYVWASLSVMKTHTKLKNNLFQYVSDIDSHWKIVDDVTQTISVIYWVWLEAIWDFDTFIDKQGTCI